MAAGAPAALAAAPGSLFDQDARSVCLPSIITASDLKQLEDSGGSGFTSAAAKLMDDGRLGVLSDAFASAPDLQRLITDRARHCFHLDPKR